MANVRIEVDIEGTRALMRSPEIIAVLEAEARRRTEATGMEYRADVYPNGRTRANVGAYDIMSGESGSYKSRGNGKIVYTQRKIKEGGK